jgi:hypothetical protein
MSVKISAADFDAAPDADKPAASAQKMDTPQQEFPDLGATDIGADEIADATAAGFPKDETPPGSNPDAPKDTSGATFDPKKHRMGPDGKPMVNADGKFSKRYSRKNEKSDQDEYDATGTMLAAMVFKLFGAIFDAEEAKPDPEFEATLTDAYATALRAKGLSLTDPTWNAIGLTGIYAFGVVQKPKSNAKFKTLWAGVRSRFGGGKKPASPSGITNDTMAS